MLTFSQALEHLKNGLAMRRSGWNGKGLFVFMQVPSVITIDIVPKMQSLPQSVKDKFSERANSIHPEGTDTSVFSTIRYKNQFAIVNPDNTINGWVPSSSDIMAEDWETA